MPSLAKRLSAEALGTLFLLMTIIGSGIMGERLAGGNVAIALLANTLATGGALVRSPVIHHGPDHRRVRRCGGCALHVR
jgi:glycerol uptake facilitator-like aquaporin